MKAQIREMLNTMIRSKLYEGNLKTPEALWKYCNCDEDEVRTMYADLLEAEEENYGETRSKEYTEEVLPDYSDDEDHYRVVYYELGFFKKEEAVDNASDGSVVTREELGRYKTLDEARDSIKKKTSKIYHTPNRIFHDVPYTYIRIDTHIYHSLPDKNELEFIENLPFEGEIKDYKPVAY